MPILNLFLTISIICTKQVIVNKRCRFMHKRLNMSKYLYRIQVQFCRTIFCMQVLNLFLTISIFIFFYLYQLIKQAKINKSCRIMHSRKTCPSRCMMIELPVTLLNTKTITCAYAVFIIFVHSQDSIIAIQFI